MTLSKQSHPSNEVWKPRYLRLIAFTRSPQVETSQQWWAELAGESKDFTSIKKSFQREDTGTYKGRTLSLSIEPLRISWTLASSPERLLSEGSEDPFTLGALPEIIEEFEGLMGEWLNESCPEVKRLGFAAPALTETSGLKEAYDLLGKYLPNVKFDGFSDFMLQLNRKHKSKILNDLDINRLVKWHAATIKLYVDAEHSESRQRFPEDIRYYCAVDLDINTNQDHSDLLPKKKLCSLFNELTSIGVECTKRGDYAV